MRKFMNNNKSGITLIALVVTIIALLILAGISIQMLTGDNGILSKAGQAKNEAEIGYEKDIIVLAYDSALSKKRMNNDLTAVTSNDLNIEFNSQEANAKGNNPITVTFVESNRQYTIDSLGAIAYKGIKNTEDSNIELYITAKETESRAMILKVIAKSSEEDELTESKLREIEENNVEEIQDYFVESYKYFCEKNGYPQSYLSQLTWDYLTSTYAGTIENPTIQDMYNTLINQQSDFSSVYDFIIQHSDGFRFKSNFFMC